MRLRDLETPKGARVDDGDGRARLIVRRSRAMTGASDDDE